MVAGSRSTLYHGQTAPSPGFATGGRSLQVVLNALLPAFAWAASYAAGVKGRNCLASARPWPW